MTPQSHVERSLVALALGASMFLVGCPRKSPERRVTSTAAAQSRRATAPAAERAHGGGGNRGQRNSAFRTPLLVFAATSLREAMNEIGPAFTATGRPVVEFNFAGSNALAQQIEASSFGEVFVSADESWVNHVQAAGGVVPGTKTFVLSNTLAFVAHPSSTFELTDPAALPSLRFAHLSMADPDAVPAGRYAKAYLTSLASTRGTVWDGVAARVAPSPDVRAALAIVAAQADVVGIVYRSDIRAAAVRTLYEVPAEALPTPVQYFAVAIARRPRVPLASAFVEFLTSPAARAIFERHGFVLPPAPIAPSDMPAPTPAEAAPAQ